MRTKPAHGRSRGQFATTNRLRFVEALPRTAENRVDFSLGSQARRVLIARCQPRRKPPPLKTPLANPCNPTPHWPQSSAKTHSPGPNWTKKLWEYIRKHELQDPKDKRSIRADEKPPGGIRRQE